MIIRPVPNEEELEVLRLKLQETQTLIAQLNQTWDDKLKSTEKILSQVGS